MDISDTLAPDSDQLDAVDLLGGPRTFTVARVTKSGDEQPVSVFLVEFPRPWRPGKSMRRVLAACWGTDASEWAGRRVRLYCDPAVRFGSEVVGGTRVSHLSHIDRTRKVPLLVARGRSATYVVEPLVESPAEVVAALREGWKSADAERRKLIEAEVARLTGTPAAESPADEPELPDPTDGQDPWTLGGAP